MGPICSFWKFRDQKNQIWKDRDQWWIKTFFWLKIKFTLKRFNFRYSVDKIYPSRSLSLSKIPNFPTIFYYCFVKLSHSTELETPTPMGLASAVHHGGGIRIPLNFDLRVVPISPPVQSPRWTRFRFSRPRLSTVHSGRCHTLYIFFFTR